MSEILQACIGQAQEHKITNGMAPAVFEATTLDGTKHTGFNFQPVGTKVGHTFHYDHGVGIARNQDAKVVWIMESDS